jgi:predicted TIM-barrel fold metal-dependent hydrolase
MSLEAWHSLKGISQRPEFSHLITRRRLLWLIGGGGVFLIAAGMVFTPSFVAAHVKHVEQLNAAYTEVALSYQLRAITLGTLAVIVSILASRARLRLLLVVPVIAISGSLVYAYYLQPKYPDNLFLDASQYEKAWRLLTGESLTLGEYQPQPTLIVNNRHVARARYPAIDMHFHLGSLRNIGADELVAAMDAHGIAKIINLDGGPGELEQFTRDFKDKYPDRFVMFLRPPLRAIEGPNGGMDLANALADGVSKGVKGVKITKELGLSLKDASGTIVPIDDPRLDPLWTKAGELGVPIMMHVTDPTPFFSPITRFNERYEELKEFPEWSFFGPQFPPKETLLRQREHLVKKHPRTIFVAAHFGDNPENLAYVSRLLDTYANYYVDISSRLPELGREPFSARDFFIKYQDRILFGTDGGDGLGEGDWSTARFYGTYFEFLETRNEYFEYPMAGIDKQGRWRIYGLDLPDEVLKKIYFANAARLLHLEAKP